MKYVYKFNGKLFATKEVAEIHKSTEKDSDIILEKMKSIALRLSERDGCDCTAPGNCQNGGVCPQREQQALFKQLKQLAEIEELTLYENEGEALL